MEVLSLKTKFEKNYRGYVIKASQDEDGAWYANTEDRLHFCIPVHTKNQAILQGEVMVDRYHEFKAKG